MSDSSRVRLVRRLETAFGETPPANAATTLMRITNDGIVHNNATVISDELRADRQRSDLALVGYQVTGEVGGEVCYGATSDFDVFLEAALGGTWATNVLRNGTAAATTYRTFGLERGYMDLGKYIYFKSMEVNKLSLDVTARQIVKYSVDFMGSIGDAASATTICGTTTPTAAVTTTPMRAGDLIDILNSGSANTEMVGVSAKSIKFDINNGIRDHELATAYATDGHGHGVMDITGTVDTYFKDIVIYNQFRVNGFFALRFAMVDPVAVSANTIQITFPNVKVSGAPASISGGDSDIMQPISFRALLDPTLGYTIDVQRALTT